MSGRHLFLSHRWKCGCVTANFTSVRWAWRDCFLEMVFVFLYQFGCLPMIVVMPMMFCVRFLRCIGILMKLFLLGLIRAVFSLVLHRLQSMCHLCFGAVRKYKSFNLSVLAVSRNVFECVLMPGCSAFFTFVLCLAQLHVVLHSSFV